MTLLVLLPLAAAAGVLFDFEQRLHFEPGTYAKDHSLVEHDGRFHLFYTVGRLGEGWSDPGNEIDFGHASSTDLVHWTVHDRVLSIDPRTWKSRNLWAPHVVEAAGEFLMAYTGVDSSITQAIGIAASPDLFRWTDRSVTAPAFTPDTTWAQWSPGAWSNCRDPYLYRLDGRWMLLATATARPQGGGAPRGALALAFSADARTWVDPGSPLLYNDSPRVLESPCLYSRSGLHHLIFTEQAVPGLQATTSTELLAGWDPRATRQLDEGFAGEIVEAGGRTWLTRVRGLYHPDGTLGRAVVIDTLRFDGGIPRVAETNNLWQHWTPIPGGTAFEQQPTFGDRPAARSGVPSNLEGHFWINTAERYTGPLGGGCFECPPDEARTGLIRSHPFRLSGATLELRVGGTNDPEAAYIALRRARDGAILFRETGGGGDAMTIRTWHLTGLADSLVYIEIADLSTDGHITVDAIRERPAITPSGPPPAAPPSPARAPRGP